MPEDSDTIPFGEAGVVRDGDDVTIVAIGRMVSVSEEAAKQLADSGVEAAIIDPRTTSPLDTETILESVESTGRRLDGVDKALGALLGTLLDGDEPALDVAPLLSEVDIPVAVVWGRHDAVLPATNGEGLDDVEYVDHAGHMVHLEQPNAVVAAVNAATTRG